jgi:hypothetical protein
LFPPGKLLLGGTFVSRAIERQFPFPRDFPSTFANRFDHGTAIAREEGANDVFQCPDVARPGMLQEQICGGGTERFLAVVSKTMIGQQENV